MMKTFDEALWSAFVAGAFYGGGIRDEKDCAEAFDRWRAGLGDGEAVWAGSEIAVASEPRPDAEGRETNAGAKAKGCTCSLTFIKGGHVRSCPLYVTQGS